MLVVDVKLKNNKGDLKCGVVYKENKRGENPIQNKKEIDKIFEQNYSIYFQNSATNATIPRGNIENYIIREVDKNEF